MRFVRSKSIMIRWCFKSFKNAITISLNWQNNSREQQKSGLILTLITRKSRCTIRWRNGNALRSLSKIRTYCRTRSLLTTSSRAGSMIVTSYQQWPRSPRRTTEFTTYFQLKFITKMATTSANCFLTECIRR